MISVSILEPDDVIKSTDYVRQLSLVFTGQSDFLATTNTYNGKPMNRLGWMQAKDVCPFFVGKTVKEFNTTPSARHATETFRYEVIRGNLPLSHLEKI